jgi:hypothetical protein
LTIQHNRGGARVDPSTPWHTVENYILRTLLGEHTDSNLEMSARSAINPIGLHHKDDTASKRRTRKNVQVDNLRVRVIYTILGFREAHRDMSNRVFMLRWTSAARIFQDYDNRRIEEGTTEPESEHMPTVLAFPDDGTTTILELGRRVWYNEREVGGSRAQISTQAR